MKQERNYQPLLVVLVLAMVGAVGWMVWRDWNESRIEAARKQEAEELNQRSADLARKIIELEQELKKAVRNSPPRRRRPRSTVLTWQSPARNAAQS